MKLSNFQTSPFLQHILALSMKINNLSVAFYCPELFMLSSLLAPSECIKPLPKLCNSLCPCLLDRMPEIKKSKIKKASVGYCTGLEQLWEVIHLTDTPRKLKTL